MDKSSLKITELPALSVASENGFIPIAQVKEENDTYKVTLKKLRESILFENAYTDTASGVANTVNGDTFFVYTDSTKEHVQGWVNAGSGATPLLNGEGEQITYGTYALLNKALKDKGAIVQWVYNGGLSNGGEQTFTVPLTGNISVQEVYVDGLRQFKDVGFELVSGETLSFKLATPVKENQTVVAICFGSDDVEKVNEAFLATYTGPNGASNIGTAGGGTVQSAIDSLKDSQIETNKVVQAPYVITGVASITNPYWNAPQDNAGDPAAAAANAAAINRMISSGEKTLFLDGKARYINSTLTLSSTVRIFGAGKGVTSLIWNGGDAPVIARAGYQNKDIAGPNNIKISDLKISDLAATRTSYYTVDLFNGHSNGLDSCWIDCPGRYDSSNNKIITSDRYGVALGKARNSTLTTPTFLPFLRDSRIANGTLMINTTDWYVSGSELWGDFRNRSIEVSGGGEISGGTQIVPGAECGLFLFSDVGYDIDTLKIIGVYFDGSTSSSTFTGWGIKSAAGIGLLGAHIVGCNFWHMNLGGIYVSKLVDSTITSNFRDCDSDDTGEDDLVCNDVTGSYINNRHFRGTAPKNSDAARVNLGRPYTLTGRATFPISSVGGNVGYSGSYNNCSVSNNTLFKKLGGSSRSDFSYSALPLAASFSGETITYNGRLFYSDGTNWRDISGELTAAAAGTDLLAFTTKQDLYTSDITQMVNYKSGLTGPALISFQIISTGYAVLTIRVLKDGGGTHSRILSGGSTWSNWVTTSS